MLNSRNLDTDQVEEEQRELQEIDQTVDESESSDMFNETATSWSVKKAVTVLLIAILVSAGLGVGAQLIINPMIQNTKAQKALDNLWNNRGPLTPVNTEMVTFTGQTIKNVNVDQKALTGNGVLGESGVFAFNNGKTVESRKVLDIYIDFDSQKSRDFVLMNMESFKNAIESGLIELRVHPVPKGSAFSMYAPEALAEAFVVKPGAAWNFMIDLLKLSATLDTNKSDDIVDSIVETSQNNGIKDIDSASILNGTFASWITAVGDDKQLATGYYPPIAYVNGSEISPDSVNFNNTDAFMRAVKSK